MAQLVMAQQEAKSHINIHQQSKILKVIVQAGVVLDSCADQVSSKAFFVQIPRPAAGQGLLRTETAYLAVLGSCDLGQIDRGRQDGLIMNVEVPLQLCPDGCTESLQACIRSLCSHST